MAVWKQGCTWGGGKPSFYNFIKEESIVISPSDAIQREDLVAIAEGFQIKAIAKIESDATPVTQNQNLELIGNDYSIDYLDTTFFYESTWIILPQPREYRAIQGFVQIRQVELVRELEEIWSNNFDNPLPPNLQYKNSIDINIDMLNTILYGPPGTGKTFHTINKALEIIEPDFYSSHKNDDRKILKNRFDKLCEENKIVMTTFHQSYSYEDFVEGLSAESIDEKLVYGIKKGTFKTICENAEKSPNEKFVLIIDEINRGNVSNIFGELITLIEDSKRASKKEALSITLPYSKNSFSVPSNLYIIGTMNTADRSLTQIDTALRRRFHFEEMMPQPELLDSIVIGSIEVGKLLRCLNARIEALYDREHTLGHAFFMELKDKNNIETLAKIFKNKIIPLLQEYFFDDWGKIQLILGEQVIKEKPQFSNFATSHINNIVIPKAYDIVIEMLKEPDTYITMYKNCLSV